jgi:hypothetical protein
VTQQAQRGPEWFWRILAGLMLVVIGWMGWVAYQITPASVVTPAAYQALTQARAVQHVQQGLITPAPPPRKPPPVDIEKLRLADSIESLTSTPSPQK